MLISNLVSAIFVLYSFIYLLFLYNLKALLLVVVLESLGSSWKGCLVI